MKRLLRASLATVGASCLFVLASCRPEGADQAGATPAAESAAVAASPVGSEEGPAIDAAGLEPRYSATLADGITFAKSGYPEFIAAVSGVSGVEPWGRWTDANLGDSAVFQFSQVLPQRFTLEVEGYAIGPNVDQPVKVSVGNVEKIVKLGAAPAQTVTVTFEGIQSADTIRLTAPSSIQPSAVDPSNGDTRKLGIALVSLRIKE